MKDCPNSFSFMIMGSIGKSFTKYQRRNEYKLYKQDKQVKEGVAPSYNVEPTSMSKRHEIALSRTTFIEKPKLAFNSCFVLLGLHIQVPEQEYCQRPRCKKHREYHPDKKWETQLAFVKSWEIKSPRSNNTVKVATFECPRCGKRIRRYPRREQTQ